MHMHALVREAWGTADAGRLREAISGLGTASSTGFPENSYRTFWLVSPSLYAILRTDGRLTSTLPSGGSATLSVILKASL